MAERKIEVKVHRIDYECDKCPVGVLLPTGRCFTTYPPRYPHACNKCGAEVVFAHRYPRIVTEEIDLA